MDWLHISTVQKQKKNVYYFIISRRWLVCFTTVIPYVIYVGNDRILSMEGAYIGLVPRKTITMIIEWNKTEMVQNTNNMFRK